VHGRSAGVKRLSQLAHEALDGPLRGTDQVGLLQAVVKASGRNSGEICHEMASVYGAVFCQTCFAKAPKIGWKVVCRLCGGAANPGRVKCGFGDLRTRLR
jgi:hypothetical protein